MPFRCKKWYASYPGEIFDCVLASKQCFDKKVRNVFVPIIMEEGCIKMPLLTRTIRLADAELLGATQMRTEINHYYKRVLN